MAAALAYAKEGKPVFPCMEKGDKAKSPYIAGGFKSASTNLEQIKLSV